MDLWMDRLNISMDGRVYKWLDGWDGALMDEWMQRWIGRSI